MLCRKLKVQLEMKSYLPIRDFTIEEIWTILSQMPDSISASILVANLKISMEVRCGQ